MGLEVALAGQGSSTAKASGVNKTTAKSVPAFLNKLFAMVNDPETDDLIHWSKDGDSFLVPSADRFAREVLPRYFKHSNFGSFVRQCNMYGFHKVPSLQHGVLKNEDGAELLEFSNPNFLQAQPDLLCLIRRQKSRADGGSTETALDLPSLITDLAAIRKHQTAISADLKDLQTSNHALWQEAIQSRERHSRQQETINKILRFLATVFGGQVVGDDTGSSAAREGSNVVVDAGREQSQQNKGKEKADDGGRVLVPKIRSRLLLEDVKGRQAARQRERQKLDQSASPEEQEEIQSIGRDEDEEDIEEIPLLREELEDLPTISSASTYSAAAPRLSRSTPSSGALSLAGIHSPAKFDRAGMTSSRFTTLPSASAEAPLATSSASNTDTRFSMSPDVLSSILASNNSNTLDAYMQLQNSNVFSEHDGGVDANLTSTSTATGPPPNSSSGASSSTDFSRAMIPSPPAPGLNPSNPLDLLNFGGQSSSLPGHSLFAPTDFSDDYRLAINDHSQAIDSVMNEKIDIDKRTSALESAISKLMQALPEDTRDALEKSDFSNSTSPSASRVASGLGDSSSGDAASWPGTNSGDDIDLDKFLAQFVHTATTPSSGQEPLDYSAWLDPANMATSTTGPYDSTLEDLNPTNSQFEVLSPSESEATNQTAASTPVPGHEEEDEQRVQGAPRHGGRKRKSDAIEAPSPATSEGGSRRSARRKKI